MERVGPTRIGCANSASRLRGGTRLALRLSQLPSEPLIPSRKTCRARPRRLLWTAPNGDGQLTDLRSIEARLSALYAETGYARRDPAFLQPADIFVDFSGEDIRRRLFMTEGAEGQSLCLRPEFTIPLSLEYIAAQGDLPADLFAAGKVFRQRPGESGEFVQIGIERFGHAHADVVDAECLALALETLRQCGVAQPRARIGDVGLLAALLDQLAVPPAARRRLMRTLASGGSIDAWSTRTKRLRSSAAC